MYASTSAWGSLLEKQTGVKVRIKPEPNMAVKFKLLKQEAVDFCSASTGGAAFLTEGVDQYSTKDLGPVSVRSCWLAQQIFIGYLVRADSPIKTIYDIKGKKVGVSTAAVTQTLAMDALLAFAGLTWKDVTRVPYANLPASERGVLEGSCDVSYSTPTSASTLEVEAGPHGARYLPLPVKEDPEGAKRFLKVRPTLEFGICTMGAKAAHGVSMISTPYYFFTMKDKDPNVIYHLAKWLDENYAQYKDAHPVAATVDIKNLRNSLNLTFMPVHDGLIRYLKEKNLWTAADDARLKRNVETQGKYIAAYKVAVDKAEQKGLKIDPGSKEWVELWGNYKKEVGLAPLAVVPD